MSHICLRNTDPVPPVYSFSSGSLYPGMYTKLCTAVPPWNVSKLRGELFNILIRLMVRHDQFRDQMRDSRTVICTSRFFFASSDLQKFNLVYIYFVQRTVHTKFSVALHGNAAKYFKKKYYSSTKFSIRIQLQNYSCRSSQHQQSTKFSILNLVLEYSCV